MIWIVGYLMPNPLFKVSKVGDCSWGATEGSLFNSYYTRCRGERYSFPRRIAPLYSQYIPYIAEC